MFILAQDREYDENKNDNYVFLPTWSVKKVSQILNFRGYVYSIFDFFVALCWYSYPSLMPRGSVILSVQLIFDSYFI